MCVCLSNFSSLSRVAVFSVVGVKRIRVLWNGICVIGSVFENVNVFSISDEFCHEIANGHVIEISLVDADDGNLRSDYY